MKKLLTIICAFQFIGVLAQETPNQQAVRDTFRIYYNVDVEVDTAQRAYKYSPKDVKEYNGKITPQEYATKNFDVKLKDENPKIKIYKMKRLKPVPLLGNYVKAGYGPIYATPYLEAHVNSKRNKDYQYGLYYNHLSSAKGAVDKKNSGNGLNDIRAYGKKFGKNLIWSGELDFDRRRFNYYGYDQNLNLSDEKEVRDSIKQVYNQFNAKAGFESYDTSKALNYDVNLSFRNISDINKSSEREIATKIGLGYKLTDATLDVPVDLYFTSYKNGVLSQNRNFINLKPTYNKVRKGKFKYELGFIFNYENDIDTEKNVHLYPVLRGELVINQKTGMSVLAGVGGGMNRKSFHETVDENPFLDTNLVLINENTKINLYGGIEGKMAKYFTYNLTLGYKNYNNLSLFMNDSLDQSKFQLVYDNGNSGVFTTKGELYFSKMKKVLFGLVAQYDAYNMENYEKAYHRPSFTGKFISKYKVRNDFHLTMDVYYISGLFAYDYAASKDVKLNNIADVNLGAEYFLNKKFSVYGNFNNILNQSYEEFRNYNTKKFNCILGFSYAF